jgi:hypothetical protein
MNDGEIYRNLFCLVTKLVVSVDLLRLSVTVIGLFKKKKNSDINS